jgi:hypothetical protein
MEPGLVVTIILVSFLLLIALGSLASSLRERVEGKGRRTNTAWTAGMADAIVDFSRLLQGVPEAQQWVRAGEIALEMLRTWDDGIYIEEWARMQPETRGGMAGFGRKVAAEDRTLYGWYKRNYESGPASHAQPQDMSDEMAIRFAFFFCAWDQLLHV